MVRGHGRHVRGTAGGKPVNRSAASGENIMATPLRNAPPRFFAAMVSGGLVAGLLVFLAVQAMPMLGWILWTAAIVAVGIGASLWYKTESANARRADEAVRAAQSQKESD